jgi:PIN domain nuclease of toxin-antitoxin system
MRILLDTHILLWTVLKTALVPRKWLSELESPGNWVAYSSASIWEIAIKASLGRADFRFDPFEIMEAANQSGFVELAIDARTAASVAHLQNHHRDPFDRLLVAQARRESAILLTSDARLVEYGDPVKLIA